jgi:PDDEXK-like domain of unknown function (DUF3799)
MATLPWQNQPRTQIVECSVADYDKARLQYMSSHMLELFRFSPRQCQWKMQGLIPSTTAPHYEFGKAFHCYLLEGLSEFHTRYEVAEGPINPKTGSPYGRDTKAYGTWFEEITAAGKQVVSGDEYTQLQMMAESVNETAARDLFAYGLPEVTIRGQLYGVSCQSRLDWFNRDTCSIVDLKSTERLERFEKDFHRFGYARQAAFYRGMADGLLLGRSIEVYIVVVEKAEPYRTQVYQLTSATLGDADEEIQQSMLQYRQLVASVGFDRPWPLSLKYGRSIITL